MRPGGIVHCMISAYLLHALREDLLPWCSALWHSHPMHSHERRIVCQISGVVRWYLCTAMQWRTELHPIHLAALPSRTLFEIDLNHGERESNMKKKIIIFSHSKFQADVRLVLEGETNLHSGSQVWVDSHRCLRARPVWLQTTPKSSRPIVDRRVWRDCQMQIFLVRTPLVHDLGWRLPSPLRLCLVPSLPDRSMWFDVSFCRCTNSAISWGRWEMHPICGALLSPEGSKWEEIN